MMQTHLSRLRERSAAEPPGEGDLEVIFAVLPLPRLRRSGSNLGS